MSPKHTYAPCPALPVSAGGAFRISIARSSRFLQPIVQFPVWTAKLEIHDMNVIDQSGQKRVHIMNFLVADLQQPRDIHIMNFFTWNDSYHRSLLARPAPARPGCTKQTKELEM